MSERIKMLAEYLVRFNKPRRYYVADSHAALEPSGAFYPAIESGQRKTLWTRLRALRRLNPYHKLL